MFEERWHAASVNLNESMIFIVGGLGSGSSRSTSVFITLEQPPIKGPDLNISVVGHCMIQYNESSIYLIGGRQGESDETNKTWIINPNNDFKFEEGPPLNFGRETHSCGKFKKNGKTLLIVAGGYYWNDMYFRDTVEILDPLTNQGWTLGMKSSLS